MSAKIMAEEIKAFDLIKINVGKIACNTFMNYSTKKEARMFQKMLNKSLAKRNSQGFVPKLLSKNVISSAFENEGCSKRIINLNKLYMENITQMLCNGKYGSQLTDLGIQISKVKLASGLNFLNIYWATKKVGIPEEVINDTLIKVLVELQEQLGSLRFMSKVPLLKFVKDLRLEREIQLDKIFEIADFGENFKSSHQGKRVVTPGTARNPETLPEMRQNVLCLDQGKIKNRILADIFKFKAINFDTNEDSPEYRIPEKLIPFDKKEFYKFYKRKRILVLKMKKKSHPVEIEYEDEDEDEDGDNLEPYDH